MFALVEITAWHWVGFIACVLVFLALDLGVFHRHAHAVKFKEALVWSCRLVLPGDALCPGASNPCAASRRPSNSSPATSSSCRSRWTTSLSSPSSSPTSASPGEHQHRVLYWGILGALIMRGLMIGVGVALISLVDWVLYLFGAFLLYSGVKMLFVQTEVHPEKNRVVQWVRKALSRHARPGRAEVRHPLGRPQSAHPAGAGAADGRNHRPALCRGFHPGDLRGHPQTLHRLHLERLCHSRPALALLPAGRAPSAISAT